jgi:2-polyprenyl-3-methyl-5-hydroxy-6-metoxy-1,4-benzoquinol methylase
MILNPLGAKIGKAADLVSFSVDKAIELLKTSCLRTSIAPQDLFATRTVVAKRYIRGTGIEFGALHVALSVPAGVTVRYADSEPSEKLRASYSTVGNIRAPDIITDIQSITCIDDSSQDFIIANHVLEHLENPLRALASIARVLRGGGVAFIALPDKRFTFDRDRQITPLNHLIRDYEEGPDWSLAGHYDEWCRCVDGLQGDAHAQKVALMLAERSNIHFHVWDRAAMADLFSYVAKRADLGLSVEFCQPNDIEVIWILRKRAQIGTSLASESEGYSAASRELDPGGEVPICPVCGELARNAVWTVAACQRDVFKCAECGFTFIWPRIEQDFSNVPEEAYYGNWEQLDLNGPSFLFTEVAAATGRRVALGLRGSHDPPTILDVGCGAGHALLDFRAHGWKVRGIDPWAAVAAAGRKYYRLPIEPVKVESARLQPGSQDVVLSLDVLQFVADPKAFLEACSTTLKPGGLLYLTVPNFGSNECRREGWRSWYFLPLSYLSYFTQATLERLVENSGLCQVKVDCFGGPEEDLMLRVRARRPTSTQLTWADLSDEVDDRDLPPLDRRTVATASLSPAQRTWREKGYLIVPRLIPDDLIENYCAVRRQVSFVEGWTSPTPYLDVPEIRKLCLYKPLTDLLEHLIGEPMGLHLNLTGWVSTERDWHQDDYLNPVAINGHYAAVWMALDQIQTDAGPFEFVPGSHRWPIIRQAKVLQQLGNANADDPAWPYESERLLTPFFEQEIKKRRAVVKRFLGNNRTLQRRQPTHGHAHRTSSAGWRLIFPASTFPCARGSSRDSSIREPTERLALWKAKSRSRDFVVDRIRREIAPAFSCHAPVWFDRRRPLRRHRRSPRFGPVQEG